MEHSLYLDGLKKALKARDITYADLADSLKMTESGVKKMLNAKDISFRRLIQICEVLDVLPGELFSSAEKSNIPVIQLTEQQERALLQDQNLLTIYWRFTIEKLSPDELSKLHKYNAADVRRYLQRLVALGLVSQKRGQFIAKYKGKFKWPDNSRLAKVLNAEWSELTLKRSLLHENDGMHRLTATKLARASYQELLQNLNFILDEAVKKSAREELILPRNQLQDFVILVATSKGIFSD